MLPASENLVQNPSFEAGSAYWGLWVREEGKGRADVTDDPDRGRVLKVVYEGIRDWSFAQDRNISVKPGEKYSFSGWVRCEGVEGSAQLSVVTRDARGGTLDWLYSLRETSGTHGWRKLEGAFLVPADCATVQFRITGSGKGVSFWTGLVLEKSGELRIMDAKDAAPLEISAGGTAVVLDPAQKTLNIRGSSKDPVYEFAGLGDGLLLDCRRTSDSVIDLSLAGPAGVTVSARIEILTGVDAIIGNGDVALTLSSRGPMSEAFAFPGPLRSDKKDSWVLPVNEGLLVPADDPYFMTWDLTLYCGHGLCMPFVGLTDGRSGFLAIAFTQNDARVRFSRPETGRTSSWTFIWEPEKQQWGYDRMLLLRRVRSGGYVGVAKAYRIFAKKTGLLFLTLREKAKMVPAVDKLIGAADVWYWKVAPWWQNDPEAEKFASLLVEAGLRRVLWSGGGSAKTIAAINDLGFLTGKYDITQDVWDPKTPVDWKTTEGWPDDIVLLPSGDLMKGWVARGKNGEEYPGGVVCSERGLEHLKTHVEKDAGIPFQARFLDTTTANPLRECWNPAHPLTRGDDRYWKMEQLDYLSLNKKLVTGSETGMDMAVPFVHYFEGMMSLGPYRLPDAGYDLVTYKTPGEEFKRFQLGVGYRIPLVELVYHDCVVSTWYWGDSSNRVPEMWDERDLYNALYGTAPLYILDPKIWDQHEKRFIQSYQWATTVARRTGYSEMLDHRFVTRDHSVQSSSFADGTKVWVNFGRKSYRLKNGKVLKPKGILALFPNGKKMEK